MLLIEQLLEHWMEAFLMSSAGLSFFGIRLRYKKLILIGVIYGMIIYWVRWFYIENGIPFGTHSLILAGSFILVLRFVGNQNYLVSTLATLTSYLFIIWGEVVVFLPVMKIFTKDLSVVGTKPGYYILGGTLTCAFLIVLFIVCYIYKKTIINLNALNVTKESRG